MSDISPVASQIHQRLTHFTGTTTYVRHWTGALLYTEGVQWLAEKAGAYWLIDAIASWQPECRKHPMLREMQFWRLNVNQADNSAGLECFPDDGHPAHVRQEIEFTDFPLAEIKLWAAAGGPGGRMVLMLPGEY